jgi:hypothetical protein
VLSKASRKLRGKRTMSSTSVVKVRGTMPIMTFAGCDPRCDR